MKRQERSMPSEMEQAVLATIDDERIVEDLERLVRNPSVDGTAAESAVQAWCAERSVNWA